MASAKGPEAGIAHILDNGDHQGVSATTTVGYETPSAPTSGATNDDSSSAGGAPTLVTLGPDHCYREEGVVMGHLLPSCVSEPSDGPVVLPAPPTPQQLAQIAYDRAVSLAEEPQLRIAPSEVGLTGLRSYFWLPRRPRPISAIADAGSLVVTAQATPSRYLWRFGDGSSKATQGHGRSWRHGNIAHLYKRKGRYDLTVSILWQARWRAGGGPWNSLGSFTTSVSESYPVREAISFLVPFR
jgi:hypothetical protein